LRDGISLRAHYLLAHVARAHEVELIHLGDAPPEAGPLGELLASRSAVPRAEPGAGAGGRIWPISARMHDAVADARRRGEPDALWATHLEMAAYVPRDLAGRCVLDVIDDQVLTRREHWRFAPPAGGRVRRMKWLLEVGLVEREAARRCRIATFASRRDARAFGWWAPLRRREVLANGVDLDAFRPLDVPEADPPTAIFYGQYAHGPNVQAARVLAREIWPAVRKRLSEARCELLGAGLGEDCRDEARRAGIEVRGFVDDLQGAIARSAVVLSPLVSGNGIKNKVLEAWAMGKAVAALPAGVAGLEEPASRVARVARTPAALADATVELLGDADKRRRLGAEARAEVEAHYDWRDQAEAFGGWVERVGRAES
jgi:glycosyltransferase involved in cell wall biosynthesis